MEHRALLTKLSFIWIAIGQIQEANRLFFLGILWQTFANQFSTDHLLLVLFNAQATNTG